jgi:hypothetical protein
MNVGGHHTELPHPCGGSCQDFRNLSLKPELRARFVPDEVLFGIPDPARRWLQFLSRLQDFQMPELQHYHQRGLAFDYPSNWELSEETTGDQRTITLQTAGASFWTLTVFDDRPDPEQIVESVLQAFRDDYEEIDVYEVQASVQGQPAAAADLDFVYLDLVNSVAIRAFETDAASVLVMYQGMDREVEDLRDRFNAVTESLAFDGDDEG